MLQFMKPFCLLVAFRHAHVFWHPTNCGLLRAVPVLFYREAKLDTDTTRYPCEVRKNPRVSPLFSFVEFPLERHHDCLAEGSHLGFRSFCFED